MKDDIIKNIGLTLLSLWIILVALTAFIPNVAGLGVLFPILAFVAVIFYILGM